MFPRRLMVTLGVAALVAVTPAFAGAAWSTMGTGSARATAGSLGAPQTVTAAGASTTTVKVTVSAGPTSPSATPSGYRVDRVTAPAVTGACYITGTTGNCDAAAVGTGSNEFRAYSWIGPNSSSPGWVSSTFATVSAAPAAPVADTAGPVITATCPTANNAVAYTRKSGGVDGTWITVCAERVSLTAADATGVNSIKLSLRAGTTSGNYLESNGNWGSSTEVQLTATKNATTGVWSIPAADNKLSAGTKTVKVYATDTVTPAANTSTTSYTFVVS